MRGRKYRDVLGVARDRSRPSIDLQIGPVELCRATKMAPSTYWQQEFPAEAVR